MAPYGHRLEGRDLVAVAEQAGVVMRIFALCVEGRSTYRIAELPYAESVEKPKARTRFGWLPDTVVDVLRNPAYVALTGSEGRSKGKARGELIAARWEPIVSRATWDRAQEVLNQRQVRRGQTGALLRVHAPAGLRDLRRGAARHPRQQGAPQLLRVPQGRRSSVPGASSPRCGPRCVGGGPFRGSGWAR